MLAGSVAARAQPYNWTPVAIHGGGFVTGILFHPTAPGLMYCRTDIGGAYRWNPTNNTWVPLLDFLGYPNNEWGLMSAESIGLDAQDTNRLYLSCGWFGSGGPNQIMISTNQGATFTRLNSPFVFESNSDGRGNGERFGVGAQPVQGLAQGIVQSTRDAGEFKLTATADGLVPTTATVQTQPCALRPFVR